MNKSNKVGLIVVAHGSNLKQSNDEIRDLVKSLKSLDLEKNWIAEAFLEKGEPSIPKMLLEANYKGITSLKILPCFVTNGVHVSKDLTSLCDQASREYPEMKIELLPHLGGLAGFANFIYKAI